LGKIKTVSAEDFITLVMPPATEPTV